MQGETEIIRSEVHALNNSELTVKQVEIIKSICEFSNEKEKIKLSLLEAQGDNWHCE